MHGGAPGPTYTWQPMSHDPAAGNRPPARVLLVEDDLVTAHLVQHLLEADGEYRVILAQDGIRGSQLVRDGEWDLVITDINLPGADGLEVMRTCKETNPDTPVLATTGHTSPGYAERAFQAGADDLLLKPLKKTELVEKVFALISRKRRRRDVRVPTVLAVGIRPGDVEAGCGGILMKHRQQGFRAVILTLLDDRVEGARVAAEALGAIGVSGQLPRGTPPTEEDILAVLKAVIDELRPVTLYIPSPHDDREEAARCYRAAIAAAGPIPNFYCYQTSASTLEFRPSIFVDVREHLEAKLAALGRLGSGDGAVIPDPERVRATGLYWGRVVEDGVAEPLERVRGSRDGPAAPRPGTRGAGDA